jgi:hypothetical protein
MNLLSTNGLPTVREVLGETLPRGLPLADGLTELVIEQPGQVLTRTAQTRIYDALIPVTTKSFGADMTPYWVQRDREGYLERIAEFVLVADQTGSIVGWTGYHRIIFDDFAIIYLDSTGMIPQWQSRGYMRKLMHRRVAESAIPGCPADRSVFLTARSESPIFYRLMRGMLDPADLYPQPAATAPEDVARCGVGLARWLGQESLLDASTLILRGAYDTLNELYADLPVTGDPVLDAMFRDQLGPLDAYLLIGRVSKKALN